MRKDFQFMKIFAEAIIIINFNLEDFKMNNEATLEKMNMMKFYGMANAFRSGLESGIFRQLKSDELLSHFIDAEYEDRYNRKLNNLIKNAKFRYKTHFSELSFGKNRNLDKNMMARFTDSIWITKGENIIIAGATGVGKSFIACAIGHQACINGFKVMYLNCLKLFSNLKLAKSDGSYARFIERIDRQSLLILDDFGLQALDQMSRLILLEILEDRYERKSVIITSQIPVKNWHDIIGEQTIADAICDRIVHKAHKINLSGESLRKKNIQES